MDFNSKLDQLALLQMIVTASDYLEDESSEHAMDEVFPGIYVGGRAAALDLHLLRFSGVTHVLNMCQGRDPWVFVDTTALTYTGAGMKFQGYPGVDREDFDMRDWFFPTADFIQSALDSGGKVLVHCYQGYSRSATIAATYLMIKRGMSAAEAIQQIRRKRAVHPNDGFLMQLCELDYKLRSMHK